VEPNDDVPREALAPVADAVIEVDPSGRIKAVDERAEQLFGWPAEDLVGCSIDVLVADRVGEREARPAGVDLLLSARRRNGAPFPAEVRLGVAGGADSGHRVALTIRDRTPVTGPTADGSDPEQEGQPAAPPVPQRGISTIAHDLNNVISVMLIYSELIERAVQGRSMDEYLGEIRAAAEHGAELTGQLRALARQSTPDPAAPTARPRLDEDLLLHAIRRRAARDAVLEAITVVVVDDHRMFAEGLSRLLGLEDDIEVLGVGATGREAVDLVEQLRPRVLLLDFDMPGGNGVLAAAEIKAGRPETMIVMISGSTDDGLILRAVEAGCSGYLTKDRAASDVASAVRTVAAGEALMSPTQMARLLPRLPRSNSGVGSDLTEHQRTVLGLLARGATNTTIAVELSSSVDVARDDVDAILTKLGAHSALEAVATAIREGVIEYNSPF
jgi:two-component system, NarL family, response regulator DevR